jgi:hypothetical protein
MEKDTQILKREKVESICGGYRSAVPFTGSESALTGDGGRPEEKIVYVILHIYACTCIFMQSQTF